MHDRDANDDLSWTAFQYVAGELSVPDARSFEASLAENREAQEAVVRATELAVVMAEAMVDQVLGNPSLPRRGGWRGRVQRGVRAGGWMAAGAAVVLLAFWGLGLGKAAPSEPTTRPPLAPRESRGDSELAQAWLSTPGQPFPGFDISSAPPYSGDGSHHLAVLSSDGVRSLPAWVRTLGDDRNNTGDDE